MNKERRQEGKDDRRHFDCCYEIGSFATVENRSKLIGQYHGAEHCNNSRLVGLEIVSGIMMSLLEPMST